jgi:hypothetical protein
VGCTSARRDRQARGGARARRTSRGPWTSDLDVDALCKQILLDRGAVDEAYARYGLRASPRATYLATFRAVQKKYPEKRPTEILADLVASTPGDEGKWFAAAKEAGLYDEALALARLGPCEPKTLTRAALDHAETQPQFALDLGLLALHWIERGYGYEISSAHVWQAYRTTVTIAKGHGRTDEVRAAIRSMITPPPGYSVLQRVLAAELGI